MSGEWGDGRNRGMEGMKGWAGNEGMGGEWVDGGMGGE